MFRQTILLENSRRSWCLFCDRDPQFSPNLSNICFFLIRGAGKSKRRLIFLHFSRTTGSKQNKTIGWGSDCR
ncbi:hypothetical protein I7I53_06051 [Histoplasma capsulatum var. duboisii H88]|uniref:Uncharacterized protein n=1 Tax=Ajellomyces capsulatus (strain H88) TaxID=544711 RepID=A0A8A1LGH6_AJEC8|nr:hypothetical protein I7I53_06051 [Histoplasma capsulatum var. duboisii H88]